VTNTPALRLSLRTIVFLLLGLLAGLCHAAESAQPEYQWPDGSPQQIRDEIFGIRFRMKREIDGHKAALAFLKREFARDPKPEVKAYMARICLFSKDWDYPEMQDIPRGLKLLNEAIKEGSLVACDVLARVKGQELDGKADPVEIARLLRNAADVGVTRSMARLGYYYAIGYGVPQNMAEAERWAQRAAELGESSGLVDIGDAFAHSKVPDYPMALHYYMQGSCYGDGDARERLKTLEKDGVPGAKLHRAIGRVHYANMSAWIAPTRVKEEVKLLETEGGDNAQALYEVGLAHLDGEFSDRNYETARDRLRRAALQGHTAARFFLIKMQLLGWGEPAKPEAIQEIEAMAQLGMAEAASYFGYVNYWGAKEAGTKRDDAKAFKYVRFAAEKGELFALTNLGFCYEHGIGTPQNYALAAKVYWLAYLRGYIPGREHVKSLLPFVK
jgi:TPR repeat protein